jgi:hypothetical protein
VEDNYGRRYGPPRTVKPEEEEVEEVCTLRRLFTIKRRTYQHVKTLSTNLKRTFKISRHRWQDTIKINLK